MLTNSPLAAPTPTPPLAPPHHTALRGRASAVDQNSGHECPPPRQRAQALSVERTPIPACTPPWLIPRSIQEEDLWGLGVGLGWAEQSLVPACLSRWGLPWPGGGSAPDSADGRLGERRGLPEAPTPCLYTVTPWTPASFLPALAGLAWGSSSAEPHLHRPGASALCFVLTQVGSDAEVRFPVPRLWAVPAHPRRGPGPGPETEGWSFRRAKWP